MTNFVTECQRQYLLHVMRTVSERTWRAGWYGGMEHALWGSRDGEHARDIDATDHERRVLLELPSTVGGWWVWDDGPKFVTLREWARMRGE